MPYLLLFLSLVLLYLGAELTLNGAENIGRYFKLSSLAIGVILIGFGTSLPELFVSQIASYQKIYDVALANIMGSNIFNLLVILGIVALIQKIPVVDIKQQIIFQFLATVLGFLTIYFKVNLISGFILLLLFGYYLSKTLTSESEPDDDETEFKFKYVVKFFLGIFSLYYGGNLLVNSAVQISELLQIESRVFSAIVVAAGTSLPELFTALITVVKKKHLNLVLGNVLGSNMFNILFILGSLGVYNFSSSYKYYLEFGALIIGYLILVYAARKKELARIGAIPMVALYLGVVYYLLNVSA